MNYYDFPDEQSSNNFDNEGFFNLEENTLYSEAYQDNDPFQSQTCMIQEERLPNSFSIEDENEVNPKYYTEEQKSLVKTRDTEVIALLNKKREKKDEKEEFKDPKSDEEKTNQKKVKKENIFEFSKEKNREGCKGCKKKCENPGKHDKFCSDNIMRKIKTNLFEVLLTFINASLKEKSIECFEKNIKKTISITPFLVKPEQEIIRNINIKPNLELLDSKLEIIFSNKISKKIKNFGPDKNKKTIEEIYKDKRQKKTINILNMTLSQCMEQINGIVKYKELEGLDKEFQKSIENLAKKESPEYINKFKDLVYSYREYFENKKPRQKKNNVEIKKDEDN